VGNSTTWECDWRVLGSKGSVLWNGGDQFRAQAQDAEGKIADVPVAAPSDPSAKAGGHAGLIKEFLECVRNGGAPETDCADNIKSLAMVLGAIESAESGRSVDIRI
jgi:predicted dehydrogenase